MKRHLVRALNRVLKPLDARVTRASEHRVSESPPLDGEAPLAATRELLGPPLQLIVLGSLGDSFVVPPNLAGQVRIFSLDAVSPGGAAGPGGQCVPLTEVVGGAKGPITFVERVVTGVSSALKPRPDLIALYGLESMYQVAREHHVDAVTLADIADDHGVDSWDYVRTDLEGLDFDVVKALGERIRGTALVEMELRFEPFYEGEPYLHEVLAYMHERGFEVLDMKPERWRAKTPNMRYATRGRTTFANTLFVNRELGKQAAPAVRQAVILGLMGYPNFAERVLEPFRGEHGAVVRELEQLLFGKADTEYLPMPEHPMVTHGTND